MKDPYKALACAVILQWARDYQAILYKKRFWPYLPLTREEKLTLKWPYTEWAKFWAEVAEIDVAKIRSFAEKIQKEMTSCIVPSSIKKLKYEKYSVRRRKR
ncbi:MAG: hypothetical protein QXK48_04025 [Candidatus Aenigmatarchaeota archaeon]